MKKNVFSPRKKEISKKIRGVIELIIIIFLVILMARSLFTFDKYLPYDETKVPLAQSEDTGFISLSYFGVDRTQDTTLISTKRLQEHIKALYDSGYVTITQEDIIDYYAGKKKLPEKSLFLMFEDGRRDTAIFAQKILEKYNYKATMMSYSNKFEDNDVKFLTLDDLKELETSTFWELGTDGHRLSYINAFDRYDNFLDCLNIREYQMMQPYLDGKYDHYLMDFIRDDYNVPKETLRELQERIGADYKAMKSIYTEGLGKMPGLYVLMHSNTGRFGTNEKASAINEEWIKNTFTMNYNREGDCLNNRKNSIYDLTRTQPQPNWYTNHILMRIWDDTKQEVAFVSGDTERKKDWDTQKGQTEFEEDTIILTSMPDTNGLAKLNNRADYQDFTLHVEMNGNVCGGQAVRLRADDLLERYLTVLIQNNVLYVKEKTGKDSKEKVLFSLDLDILDGKPPISQEEDKQAAQIREFQTKVKYAQNIESAKKASEELQKKEENTPKTVSEGAVEYKPKVSTLAVGSRSVDITFEGSYLNISIDGKSALNHSEVSVTEPGIVLLEAIVSKDGFSQRNLADDVYDGVFDKLYIETLPQGEKGETSILYDNRLHGWDNFTDICKNTWQGLVNWFIRTL